MVNYNNLNKEQRKELARYLLDISKTSIIGTITLSTLSGNELTRMAFGIVNLFLSYYCLEKAMQLLEKTK